MITDACPVCPPPFNRGPCYPVAIEPATGGTLTEHECDECGQVWRLFTDVWGWPVLRSLEPVEPAQAEANRLALALAMEGTWGGAHHAAA